LRTEIVHDIVDRDIFGYFPDYVRAIVVAKGIENAGQQPEVEKMLRRAEAGCEALFAQESLTTHPRIASWRGAYRVLNMGPGKNYSSVESLARRARGGSSLPYISTLVALMNGFSLKHLVPCGGDDLDCAQGNLILRLAAGEERFVPLGAEEVSHPKPGEAVYVDERQVLCRRWNWRQGDGTKITPTSRNVLINIDCLPPVDADEAKRLAAELAEIVERHCGGSVRHHLLGISEPSVEIG
jgi:DNA/RNA-binding domain of Phe-tRNA-synthetase-like protein